MQHQKLTFYEHILEIRKRLFYVFAVFVLGSILGFAYNPEIQTALTAPLGQQLYYMSPMGGFSFMFNIGLFAGVIIAIPFCVLNIIKFVAPTIGYNRSAFALKLLIASILLTAAGISFAYYVSLPPTLSFLTGFNSDTISSMISTTEYFSFMKLYLAAFALIFQIPLLLVIINQITPINPQKMLKTQKYVIAGSFIAAALISPTPDVVNQTLMAAPMIVLYELSIVLIWFINRKKYRRGDFAAQKTIPDTPFDYLASIDDFVAQPIPINQATITQSNKGSLSGIIQNESKSSSGSISGILSESAQTSKSKAKHHTSDVKKDVKQVKKHIDIKHTNKNTTLVTQTNKGFDRGRVQRRYFADRNTSYISRQQYNDRAHTRPLIDDFSPRTATAS
jgi:sec-independent protein translocase protein TatC